VVRGFTDAAMQKLATLSIVILLTIALAGVVFMTPLNPFRSSGHQSNLQLPQNAPLSQQPNPNTQNSTTMTSVTNSTYSSTQSSAQTSNTTFPAGTNSTSLLTGAPSTNGTTGDDDGHQSTRVYTTTITSGGNTSVITTTVTSSFDD
jgi:hypothetical protein